MQTKVKDRYTDIWVLLIAPLRPTLMTVLLCYPRIPGDHIADVCIIPCIL